MVAAEDDVLAETACLWLVSWLCLSCLLSGTQFLSCKLPSPLTLPSFSPLYDNVGPSPGGLPFADHQSSGTALTTPLPFAPYSAPSANDLIRLPVVLLDSVC